MSCYGSEPASTPQWNTGATQAGGRTQGSVRGSQPDERGWLAANLMLDTSERPLWNQVNGNAHTVQREQVGTRPVEVEVPEEDREQGEQERPRRNPLLPHHHEHKRISVPPSEIIYDVVVQS